MEGALRCRSCGADAREPVEVQGVGAALPRTSSIVEAFQAAELLDQLQQVAPPVAAWWKTADGGSRRKVAEILGSIRDIIRRRWPEPPAGG